MAAVILIDLPRVTKIKHSIEPLWKNDAGRNSNSGKYSGTFVGWFDKITVEIGHCNQQELTTIRNAIEKATFQATFPDSKTGTDKTEYFYGTAIETEQESIKNGFRYKPFSFSIIAVSKR